MENKPTPIKAPYQGGNDEDAITGLLADLARLRKKEGE